MNQSPTKQPIDSPPIGKKTKRQQIENYLITRFQFRYNEMTGGVEWTLKSNNNFVTLDDYKLNSLCRQIDSEIGVSIEGDALNKMLKSDFTPSFHPLKTYFSQLPLTTGTSTIDALAATVITENPELFRRCLTNWLVAAVANAIEKKGCQNQTCLVLTGEQGAFKTTWLNALCPPSLGDYLYCGRIDLQKTDTYRLLACTLIINLDDQLKEINKKDSETIKTLISHGNVTARLPFATLFSYLPRSTSFVASLNGSEFLTDPTGARRFLPFEVRSIDLDATKQLDINKAWSEAYQLYQAKHRYWFTADETNELFGNNEQFQVHTPEYELLIEHYEPVAEDQATNFLTTTNILADLQSKTRQILREKQMGQALKKLGFVQKSKRDGSQVLKRYAVRQRSIEEIAANSKAM